MVGFYFYSMILMFDDGLSALLLQGSIKKGNRHSEILMRDVEVRSVCLSVCMMDADLVHLCCSTSRRLRRCICCITGITSIPRRRSMLRGRRCCLTNVGSLWMCVDVVLIGIFSFCAVHDGEIHKLNFGVL
jgi:hypothetical protein